ncbi:hypothetical protein EUX98_g7387 [Antrodiella citrinella]|uniref:Uncharacterized protein n=1 Tax=Antrodiella citrinella TaxID=2447956 RepID=A0A4S4MLN7_9APHY|nr:hypothetical protein EUX98_g7387 [Antrodiella citrinella]
MGKSYFDLMPTTDTPHDVFLTGPGVSWSPRPRDAPLPSTYPETAVDYLHDNSLNPCQEPTYARPFTPTPTSSTRPSPPSMLLHATTESHEADDLGNPGRPAEKSFAAVGFAPPKPKSALGSPIHCNQDIHGCDCCDCDQDDLYHVVVCGVQPGIYRDKFTAYNCMAGPDGILRPARNRCAAALMFSRLYMAGKVRLTYAPSL